MKLTTLTLCPAFDLHCYTETFRPYHENLAEITALEAGGKGINIARALKENGIASTVVVLLGEENATSFEAALCKSGIDYIGIPVPGRIRENVTLHEDHADETRICFRGFSVGKEALDKVEACLAELPMPEAGKELIDPMTELFAEKAAVFQPPPIAPGIGDIELIENPL